MPSTGDRTKPFVHASPRVAVRTLAHDEAAARIVAYLVVAYLVLQ